MSLVSPALKLLSHILKISCYCKIVTIKFFSKARFEAQREAELDEMMEEEMKLLWKKRIEEYKKERASRDKLLQEVIDVRRDQIQRKRTFVFFDFINFCLIILSCLVGRLHLVKLKISF